MGGEGCCFCFGHEWFDVFHDRLRIGHDDRCCRYDNTSIGHDSICVGNDNTFIGNDNTFIGNNSIRAGNDNQCCCNDSLFIPGLPKKLDYFLQTEFRGIPPSSLAGGGWIARLLRGFNAPESAKSKPMPHIDVYSV